MNRFAHSLLLAVVLVGTTFGQTRKPLLMRDPSLSKTQIVFAYAGDLWLVPRDGGKAQQLTSGAGKEAHPIFSPDGNTVADLSAACLPELPSNAANGIERVETIVTRVKSVCNVQCLT